MARYKTPERTPTAQGACVALVTQYALAAPGANTNMLATSFKVSESASAIRITVCLTTGSVFNKYVTDGSTAYVCGLNGSTALNAGDEYTFTTGVRRYSSQSNTTELSYNFQVETDGVVRFLFVDEVTGPVL